MNSSNTRPFILLDEKDASLTYTPALIQLHQCDNCYGGFRTIDATSLSCQFNGTSIAFHSLRDASTGTWKGQVDLDNQKSENISFSYDSDYTAMMYDWASFADLDEGTHNLTISNLNTTLGAGIDYAYVTPGLTTKLNGRTMIVDTTDKGLLLKGSWNESKTPFGTEKFQANVPFLGSSHQSTQVGDELLFSFYGSSIAVYGYRLVTEHGTVSVNWTIDKISKTESWTSNGTEWNGLSTLSNFQWFSATDLKPGPHVLHASVTEMTGSQPFILDYLTYTAEFDTIADLPALLPIVPTTEPIPSASTSGTSRTNHSSKSHVGAIAGGVVGGVVGIFLLGILVLYFHKKRRNTQHETADDRLDTTSPPPYTEENTEPEALSPELLSPISIASVTPFMAQSPVSPSSVMPKTKQRVTLSYQPLSSATVNSEQLEGITPEK